MKKKTSLILCITLLLALNFPALMATTVPQLALGGGYECVLIVHNHNATAWTGTASLMTGNELPWEGTWSVQGAQKSGSNTFAVSLGAGGTSKFVLSGDSQVRAGYLVLLAAGGGSEQGISSSFFYNLKGGSGQLLDSTGVPLLPAASHFVLPVEKASGVNTGFAWAPLCIKIGFDIRLQLFDSAGALLRTKTQTFDGHYARFFDEAFNDATYAVPTPFLGRMEVQSEELLHMTSLRLETPPGTIQLTSTPPSIPLTIESIAFDHRETLPMEFSCQGQGISPPLDWRGTPPGVQSWALIVEDPDAPGGVFVHWVLYAIPAATRSIGKGEAPSGARQGLNDVGQAKYAPPCPPPGSKHRYFFKLYALDTALQLATGATAAQLRQAMQGHILSSAQFLGYF